MITILITIIVLYLIFNPFIDKTSNGDIIIWYDWGKERRGWLIRNYRD